MPRRGIEAVDNQYFDATPGGIRRYLETIRPANPDLYAQLSPEVGRLEERATIARTLMIAGLAAGVASAICGIATRNDCVSPPVTDPSFPSFGADAAAWDACNRGNLTHVETFGLIGLGLTTMGLIGGLATRPTRAELLDVVNQHNRVSPHPMQLQLGFDPVQHLARAGAVISF